MKEIWAELFWPMQCVFFLKQLKAILWFFMFSPRDGDQESVQMEVPKY